jgi:peptide/nickel transport system substrate-binding protein
VKFAHQGRAYLDGIKYIITPEDSVRIGALLAGQADAIRQIQAYDEPQVVDAGYAIYAPGTRGLNNAISFRPENPLVSDIRVRQALLYATNRQEIVDTLFSANYPLATSVLSSKAAGYVDLSAKLIYDQEKAKTLFAEAGWTPGADGILEKDGSKLDLTVYVSLPQPQNEAVLQLLAQQWAQVGVKLNVLAGDAGSRTLDLLDPLKTPVNVTMVGRADPDVIKSAYYPKNRDWLLQKGGSSDKAQSFVDDKLNGLLEGLAAETDRTKRLAIAGEIQNHVIDEAYTIPFFEEPQAFATAPYVNGLEFEAVGRPSFYNTWVAAH